MKCPRCNNLIKRKVYLDANYCNFCGFYLVAPGKIIGKKKVKVKDDDVNI